MDEFFGDGRGVEEEGGVEGEETVGLEGKG